MMQCRYVYDWHARPSRCSYMGWWFGWCAEHFLEKFKWEPHWKYGWLRVNLANFGRPFVQVDMDRPISYVAIGWGLHGCDPALEIGWQRPRSDHVEHGSSSPTESETAHDRGAGTA